MPERHLRAVPHNPPADSPERRWHYQGIPCTYAMYSLFVERDEALQKVASALQVGIDDLHRLNGRMSDLAQEEGFVIPDEFVKSVEVKFT
jgi:hypothetical protein